MTVENVRIMRCPASGCHGWLWTRRDAFTMRCVCDMCKVVFVVCRAFGKEFACAPWEEADIPLRRIAEAVDRETDQIGEMFKSRKPTAAEIIASGEWRRSQRHIEALARTEETQRRMREKSLKFSGKETRGKGKKKKKEVSDIPFAV